MRGEVQVGGKVRLKTLRRSRTFLGPMSTLVAFPAPGSFFYFVKSESFSVGLATLASSFGNCVGALLDPCAVTVGALLEFLVGLPST